MDKEQAGSFVPLRDEKTEKRGPEWGSKAETETFGRTLTGNRLP